MSGSSDAAATSAASLAAVQTPAQFGSFGVDLSQSIRAQMALENRNPGEAERILTGIQRSVWYQFGLTTPFGSTPRERFLLGMLLEDRGRYQEAIEEMNFPRESSVYDWSYVAPSHLRRAAAFEALDDSASAILHYTRFVQLWSDCDPEFLPLVDHARARLAALSS